MGLALEESMRNDLGELFLRARTSKGWTLQDLAWRAGYKNENKGARHLEQLERHGVLGPRDLVKRAAAALGLDPKEVADAKARDEATRQAVFAAWLEVPQPMVLIGYVVGITFCVALPEGLSESQAVDYAMDVQKKRGHRMCLVLDRKRSMWIEADGEASFTQTKVDQPNFPYVALG
jgi:hypothetical protein